MPLQVVILNLDSIMYIGIDFQTKELVGPESKFLFAGQEYNGVPKELLAKATKSSIRRPKRKAKYI